MNDEQLQEWQALLSASELAAITTTAAGANVMDGEGVIMATIWIDSEYNAFAIARFYAAAPGMVAALLAEAAKVRRGYARYSAFAVQSNVQPMTFDVWLDMLTGENGEAQP